MEPLINTDTCASFKYFLAGICILLLNLIEIQLLLLRKLKPIQNHLKRLCIPGQELPYSASYTPCLEG